MFVTHFCARARCSALVSSKASRRSLVYADQRVYSQSSYSVRNFGKCSRRSQRNAASCFRTLFSSCFFLCMRTRACRSPHRAFIPLLARIQQHMTNLQKSRSLWQSIFRNHSTQPCLCPCPCPCLRAWLAGWLLARRGVSLRPMERSKHHENSAVGSDEYGVTPLLCKTRVGCLRLASAFFPRTFTYKRATNQPTTQASKQSTNRPSDRTSLRTNQ